MKEYSKRIWQIVLVLVAIAVVVTIYAIKVENMERENKSLSGEISTLSDEINTLEASNRILKETNESLQEHNDGLSSQILGLTIYGAECELKNDTLEKNISNLDKTIDTLREEIKSYGVALDNLESEWWDKMSLCYSEYPYATIVYIRLRLAGYSDAVTCGIIGNMMIECACGDLDFYPYITGTYGGIHYYGICQWSERWHSEVQNAGLNEQIDYLIKTIPTVMGNRYTTFKELSDARASALTFAKIYENPGPATYEKRMQAAEKAYEYFVR